MNPVDTGHKLNVHKTFRRRPGRLLNVLFTFNLRHVSTGKQCWNNYNQMLSGKRDCLNQNRFLLLVGCLMLLKVVSGRFLVVVGRSRSLQVVLGSFRSVRVLVSTFV